MFYLYNSGSLSKKEVQKVSSPAHNNSVSRLLSLCLVSVPVTGSPPLPEVALFYSG